MKKFAYLCLILLAGSLTTEAFAQHPTEFIRPREEDHFWRTRVISRIDLSEKINSPLIDVQSPELYPNTSTDRTSGIVAALFNGLKNGKYLAHDPDDLAKTLTFADVKAQYDQINSSIDIVDPWETEEIDLIDPDIDMEEFDLYDLEEEGDGLFEEDVLAAAPNPDEMDLSAFESVLELIEDQIMDKNRSDMVHDIQYLRIVWVDPGETLPDKNFICLKYSDVVELLDNTLYSNKHNDAESRTAREVLDLRLFNSYVINVSGRGVRTMGESEYRRVQLNEFEHNLWSY